MGKSKAVFNIASIQDLIGLGENDIFRMDRIQWWLLKYRDYILELKAIEENKHLFKQNDGGYARLPSCSINKANIIQISVFDSLEIIADLHKNEVYFKGELIDFKDIGNKAQLINWISRNEKIGGDDYVCFLLDYLDYAENAEHLSVFCLYAKTLNIYINKFDFQYTLQFLEIFNKYYWEDDILGKFQ